MMHSPGDGHVHKNFESESKASGIGGCNVPGVPSWAQGWVCPQCGAVMSPFMSVCVYCQPKTYPGFGTGPSCVLPPCLKCMQPLGQCICGSGVPPLSGNLPSVDTTQNLPPGDKNIPATGTGS